MQVGEQAQVKGKTGKVYDYRWVGAAWRCNQEKPFGTSPERETMHQVDC